MSVDFNSAPDGSTHWERFGDGVAWYKVASIHSGPPCFVSSPIDSEWVALPFIPIGLMPVPDPKEVSLGGPSEAWISYAEDQRHRYGSTFTEQEARIRSEVSMKAFYAGWNARCGS